MPNDTESNPTPYFAFREMLPNPSAQDVYWPTKSHKPTPYFDFRETGLSYPANPSMRAISHNSDDIFLIPGKRCRPVGPISASGKCCPVQPTLALRLEPLHHARHSTLFLVSENVASCSKFQFICRPRGRAVPHLTGPYHPSPFHPQHIPGP
ncbi:hypothetical protein M413DRAFT_31054 [Hebeloma cylindrosporum]|uniref:Uncharacterized protein n=1 Tax=Hebeloma cylindrosporum TaxID=76867 RepID=A0A0C3C102_HEBCY|nr:hypothetical protein M413DRAFT_31054 [Hebeloma cylindrosporum h7]